MFFIHTIRRFFDPEYQHIERNWLKKDPYKVYNPPLEFPALKREEVSQIKPEDVFERLYGASKRTDWPQKEATTANTGGWLWKLGRQLRGFTKMLPQ